jgi:hypothetical protein
MTSVVAALLLLMLEQNFFILHGRLSQHFKHQHLESSNTLSFFATSSCIEAFAPAHNHHRQQPPTAPTSTSLQAIGVFVRKAKEADAANTVKMAPPIPS